MEVSVQLHALVALYLKGKKGGEGAEWTSAPVWALRRREKFFCFSQE
jgi:hypothetical protein